MNAWRAGRADYSSVGAVIENPDRFNLEVGIVVVGWAAEDPAGVTVARAGLRENCGCARTEGSFRFWSGREEWVFDAQVATERDCKDQTLRFKELIYVAA